MVLMPHALGGAVAGLLFRDTPLAALGAGFLSHFVLDAIPHWHYTLRSKKRSLDRHAADRWTFDRTFLFDLCFIGLDATLGMVLVIAATASLPPVERVSLALGAVGGIMADAFQLIYAIFPHSPVKYLQRFHMWAHSVRRLDDRPLLGIGSLVVFALCMFAVLGSVR